MSSKVYWTATKTGESPVDLGTKAVRLFKAAKFGPLFAGDELVALKQHFGDGQGEGYLKPPVARAVAQMVKSTGGKPFLTETATLYRGSRSNAVDHLNLAYAHGFTPEAVGCPIVMSDGLVGAAQVEVEINGKHYKRVPIAAEISHARALIVLTHVTGHMVSGLGGSIKNAGMGLSSRAGKMSQHHDSVPIMDAGKCTACGTCVQWCPADAITIEEKATLNKTKCIGCGECLAVCPAGAVGFEWGETATRLVEKMAEHALGVARLMKGRVVYFNFAVDVTRDCDCMGRKQARAAQDAGILASSDPVALDLATVELMNKQAGKDVFREMWPELDWKAQLTHAEAIGLGSTRYELLEV